MSQKEVKEERNEIIRIAGKYLISLIRKALIGERHNIQPEGCTWEQVYALAKNNSVEAMSFYGLTKELVPEKLYKEWLGMANMTLFRQVSFDAERELILSGLEKKGISYLPLKGIKIVNYYPQPGMRSMADNDILYGIVEPCPKGGYQLVGKDEEEKELYIKKAQDQVVEIMRGRGYTVESLAGNHDCYMKEPCFNFEMHRELMRSTNPMYWYYEDVWTRAIQDKDNDYAYSFTDEDEYIYLLAHAYKHFDNSGCGIRCTVDQYVFLKKREHSMNWNYIEGELDKLEIREFEQQLKNLALHALEEGELTEQDENLLLYMLGCGTYGNVINTINNTLNKMKDKSNEGGIGYKLKYWKDRFFWSKERCKETYPFFYKHYWLIGFLPIYRVIKGLIIHPGVLWKEFVNVWKHK